MFDIKFRGARLSTYSCMLATIPTLVPSTKTMDRYIIPYRDGELLGSKSYRGNAHIQYTIHMKLDESNKAVGYFTEKEKVKRWLNQSGQLFIYEDKSNPIDRAYYEVLNTTFNNERQYDKSYWRIGVDMEVYPFKFLLPNDSVNISTTASTISNDGDICKPLYQVNANTAGNLTVNGYDFELKERTATKIVIDTRRKIAYDPTNNTFLSDKVEGDYERLWLNSGNNSVKAPASGVMYLNKGVII